MKINSVAVNNNYNSKADKRNVKNNQAKPSFKGLMDFPGWAMNGIENGGFLTSFLIQDTLGMTVPRTATGTVRGISDDRIKATANYYKAKLLFQQPKKEDEEKRLHLKDLNFKEGAEVGIREGLSGPFMMFTPILVLLAGKKFVGKSTFTNSNMIKRLGQSMKELVSSTKHDSVDSLRNDFYKKNITKMVKDTTKSTNAEAETKFIDDAVESMKLIDKLEAEKNKIPVYKFGARHKAAKAQKEAQSVLVQKFNDFHKENSSEYGMLNNVRLDDKTFSTSKTIDGIRAYAKDALDGQKAENVTEKRADSVLKKSMVGRFFVNLAAAFSTVGSLSLVPMIYKLVNPVPPGALGDPNTADAKAKEMAQNKDVQNDKADNKPAAKANGNVSFTGKASGMKKLYEGYAKHFEFDGNQLTPQLMLTLAAGGLLTPRVVTAAKRAPEDPKTKKKDYSEIPEIITRDVISTGAVTFGVPILSKLIINSYEKKSGFVLGDRKLSSLNQIYGNIDSDAKLNTFTKYIDDNNGNLAKIFKADKKNSKVIFEKEGIDLEVLAKGDNKTANKTIIEKLKNKDFSKKVLEGLKTKGPKDANGILKHARTLSSVPSFLSTFFFVPMFLGLVLPHMVYGMTAKRHKQASTEGAQQPNAAAQQPQVQAQATPATDKKQAATVDNTKKSANVA